MAKTMPTRSASKKDKPEFAVVQPNKNHGFQRSSKVERVKSKNQKERHLWADEAFLIGRDVGRPGDKAMTQEVRASREDNAPAESLGDLSM